MKRLAHTGTRAYLRTITHGLVRGVVTAIGPNDLSIQLDDIPETASWHGQNGNPWAGRLETYPHSEVVPAFAVIWPNPDRGQFHPRINPFYEWVPDAPPPPTPKEA